MVTIAVALKFQQIHEIQLGTLIEQLAKILQNEFFHVLHEEVEITVTLEPFTYAYNTPTLLIAATVPFSNYREDAEALAGTLGSAWDSFAAEHNIGWANNVKITVNLTRNIQVSGN